MGLDLVTGSSGLLGRCLVARLRVAGRRVRLFDMEPPPADVGGDGVETVRADMRDPARVGEAVRGVEVIYHLAAGQRMKPQFAHMGEDDIRRMNVAGVANVLAAARASGVRRVVFISSSGIYGVPATMPVREDHPQRPIGDYGRSKVEAEHLCLEHVAQGGDAVILRPMSLFGPYMSGVFVLLFDWVRRSKRVYLLGSGRNRVQMVSAWDVADACRLAAEVPAARGGIFNLGAEIVPTVREQVEALIAHAGSRSRLLPIPAGLLRSAARALNLVGLSPIVPEHYLLADTTFILDLSRAASVLGWRPQRGNVQLMSEAYDWYVEHADQAVRPRSPLLALLDALP